jgi:S1-C subfamily serine protease
VILFLRLQHVYEDYEPDNQPDWIGRLRRADQNRQVEHTVQLEAGETYRIIGSCDVDCGNMDMEVFGPDGSKVGENLAPDDRPFVEITPDVSGAYRVHPWVVVCRATPCYGGVRVLRMQPRLRSGTAFLISASGYLLTAAHVVENRSQITIHTASGEVAAEVISRDRANDVALLRAEMTGTPLYLASARDIRRGQEVMTLGYPLVEMQGESQKATFGRVNALSGLEDDVRFIQTDTNIQPGNSGGPLLSADGRVVGVMTATINQRAVADSAGTVAQNVNFALKTDYILPLLPSDALPEAVAPEPLADFEATAAFAEGSVFRVTAE